MRQSAVLELLLSHVATTRVSYTCAFYMAVMLTSRPDQAACPSALPMAGATVIVSCSLILTGMLLLCLWGLYMRLGF